MDYMVFTRLCMSLHAQKAIDFKGFSVLHNAL